MRRIVVLTAVTITSLIAVSLCSPSMASEDSELSPLFQLVEHSEDPKFRLDILQGIRKGLDGKRNAAPPANWAALYPVLRADKSLQPLADELAIIFGDETAIKAILLTVGNDEKPLPERVAAIETLAKRQHPGFEDALHSLLDDRPLRVAALRALAYYENATTPAQVISRFNDFSEDEKRIATQMLSSRAAFAQALLDAMHEATVRPRDVSSYSATQIAGHGNAKMTKTLKRLWGEIRQTDQQKREAIARYKSLLDESFLKKANLPNGRRVYSKTCASCHRLFDDGGDVGPNLTGSNRKNLDYVLENVIAPSSTVGRDYLMQRVELENGRALQAIIIEQSPTRITLQTATEKLVLATEDVAEIVPSQMSLMPEGQLGQLSDAEVRDLVAYLRADRQVDLPKP